MSERGKEDDRIFCASESERKTQKEADSALRTVDKLRDDPPSPLVEEKGNISMDRSRM